MSACVGATSRLGRPLRHQRRRPSRGTASEVPAQRPLLSPVHDYV